MWTFASRSVTSFYQTTGIASSASLDKFTEPKRALPSDVLWVCAGSCVALLSMAGDGSFIEVAAAAGREYGLSTGDWLLHAAVVILVGIVVSGLRRVGRLSFWEVGPFGVGLIVGAAGLLPHLNDGLLSNALPDWGIRFGGMACHRVAVMHSCLVPIALLVVSRWLWSIRWLACGISAGMGTHFLVDLAQSAPMFGASAVTSPWNSAVVVGLTTPAGAAWLAGHGLGCLFLAQVVMTFTDRRAEGARRE